MVVLGGGGGGSLTWSVHLKVCGGGTADCTPIHSVEMGHHHVTVKTPGSGPPSAQIT